MLVPATSPAAGPVAGDPAGDVEHAKHHVLLSLLLLAGSLWLLWYVMSSPSPSTATA